MIDNSSLDGGGSTITTQTGLLDNDSSILKTDGISEESVVEEVEKKFIYDRTICYDDGTGRNVYYINRAGVRSRRVPDDYVPEYLENGERRYYFRGQCIRCRKEDTPAILLIANQGNLGYSLNICDTCIVSTCPGIKRIRGNGTKILEVNIDTAKSIWIDLHEKDTNNDRSKIITNRALEAQYYVNEYIKSLRDKYRALKLKNTAAQYDVNEDTCKFMNPVAKSWGYGDLEFDEYYGETLKNNEPHGFGVKFYSDGTTYVGKWEDGLPHDDGKGIWQRPDGTNYTGQFVAGLKHGKGVQLYLDGGTYTGEWAKGFEHGQGVRKYPDGSVFEGRFRFGRRDGQGVLTHKDGTVERQLFRDSNAIIEKPPPSITEGLQSINPAHQSPFSLKEICIKMLAQTMHKHPEKAPPQKVSQLAAHNKPLVANEYLRTMQPEGSPTFLATAPSLAFADVESVRYTSIKMLDVDVQALFYLQGANKVIQSLVLRNINLSARSIDIIAHFLQKESWKTISTIDLSFNKFEINSVQNFIAGIKAVKSLTTVILSGCGIKVNGGQMFAKLLQTDTHIKDLDLSFNTVEAAGASAIAESLLVNTTLTSLNLRQNKIGMIGGQAFADVLKENRTLEVLVVADNRIGPDIVCVIAGRLNGLLKDVARSVCYRELDMPPLYAQGRFDSWKPDKVRHIQPGDIDDIDDDEDDNYSNIEIENDNQNT